MPRLRATIPHPDAHRVIPYPAGQIEVTDNEVTTEDQDVVHFLLRNDFVLVAEDTAAEPASTNPSASATKDADAEGAASPRSASRRKKDAE